MKSFLFLFSCTFFAGTVVNCTNGDRFTTSNFGLDSKPLESIDELFSHEYDKPIADNQIEDDITSWPPHLHKMVRNLLESPTYKYPYDTEYDHIRKWTSEDELFGNNKRYPKGAIQRLSIMYRNTLVHYSNEKLVQFCQELKSDTILYLKIIDIDVSAHVYKKCHLHKATEITDSVTIRNWIPSNNHPETQEAKRFFMDENVLHSTHKRARTIRLLHHITGYTPVMSIIEADRMNGRAILPVYHHQGYLKTASVNAQDAQGFSPLSACFLNDIRLGFFRVPMMETMTMYPTKTVECLKILLSKGADASQVTKDGFSPLHLAAGVGNLPAYNLLVENGASPAVEFSRPVSQFQGALIRNANESLLDFALNFPLVQSMAFNDLFKFRPDLRLVAHKYPLGTRYFVERSPQTKMAIHLIETLSIDYTKFDIYCKNIYRYAVIQNNFPLLSYLVDKPGFSVEMQDPIQKSTLLMDAVKTQNLFMVQFLLNLASVHKRHLVNMRDATGLTATDIASCHTTPVGRQIMSLLNENGSHKEISGSCNRYRFSLGLSIDTLNTVSFEHGLKKNHGYLDQPETIFRLQCMIDSVPVSSNEDIQKKKYIKRTASKFLGLKFL